MIKRFRNTIPVILLLVLSITLSGCTKEVKESFNQGKQDAQEQIQQQEQQPPVDEQSQQEKKEEPQTENDLFHDFILLTSLKAGLDEQHH